MCVVGRSGLVGASGLLGLQSDTTLLIGLHGDGLVVDESSILLGVLVRQVEGVARELDAACSLALNEVGIVAACSLSFSIPTRVRLGLGLRRTDNLPEEIGGDVRHVGLLRS